MRALTENKWHVHGPSYLHHSTTVRVHASTSRCSAADSAALLAVRIMHALGIKHRIA